MYWNAARMLTGAIPVVFGYGGRTPDGLPGIWTDREKEPIMRWVTVVALAGLALVTPRTGVAQRGGFGGRGGFGNGGFNDPFGQNRLQVPDLPGPELDGPLSPDSARTTLELEADALGRYTQAYDSFMVATRIPRTVPGPHPR